MQRASDTGSRVPGILILVWLGVEVNAVAFFSSFVREKVYTATHVHLDVGKGASGESAMLTGGGA